MSHEYTVLSKGFFVCKFYKKFGSSFMHVFKAGTRGFNKISVKLLNHCVRRSGPPDIGVPFQLSGH